MHIGILRTDAVSADLEREHGDYPAMFRALFTAAAGERTLRFSDYDVRAGDYPPALAACDAYVVTGSRDSVYDGRDWIRTLAGFLEACDAARHKLVGICFGHQLVGHCLGGRTEPAAAGWGVGVHTVRVLAREPWMEPAADAFALLSSHRDQVVALPPRARSFAGSDFCPHAGFTIGGHIITFQGHPEFTRSYVEMLMRARQDRLGEPCFSNGLASLAEPTDEILIGRWILNFLAG